MQEGVFDGYDKIAINADALVTNKRSKEILDQYPIMLNADNVLSIEGEVEVVVKNGNHEIKQGLIPHKDVLLVVNGSLFIEQDTEEVVQKYVAIIVNGMVQYPDTMGTCLSRMTVNGLSESYPYNSIVLKRTSVLDSYFPIRAKENKTYFASGKIVLTDTRIDIQTLVDKNVYFKTPKLIVTEDILSECIGLFEDNAELVVLPNGCSYLGSGTVLDEGILNKYGTKLYADGDITFTKESSLLLPKLEYIGAAGCIRLLADQVEAFHKIKSQYTELKVIKGKIFDGEIKVVLDRALLEVAPEGIYLNECINVMIAEDITPELILEKLQMDSCINIACHKDQQSAVYAVGNNLKNVKTSDEKEAREEQKKEELVSGRNTCINADYYTL